MCRFSKENFPKVLSIVDAVSAIGKKNNATPGQIALAWLLEQGADIIPIPGTRKQQVCKLYFVDTIDTRTDPILD